MNGLYRRLARLEASRGQQPPLIMALEHAPPAAMLGTWQAAAAALIAEGVAA